MVPPIDHCRDCPYREYGPAIGTRGNPASPVVLVGEAPGEREVEAGQPFVGPAGDVLWRALRAAGLDERDVFVVNSVACRPFHPARRKVRRPSTEAVNACHDRLATDLGAHPRSVLVALGRSAVQAVTGERDYPLTTKAPDSELASEWGKVVPTLHPAFVLRRGPDRPEYAMLVSDLGRVRGLAADGRRQGA